VQIAQEQAPLGQAVGEERQGAVVRGDAGRLRDGMGGIP